MKSGNETKLTIVPRSPGQESSVWLIEASAD